jgi:hypothetical protein
MKELVLVMHCDNGRDHPATQTIPFIYRGIGYELDACDDHASEYDTYMQELIDVSRKVKRGKRKATAPATPTNSQPGRPGDDEKAAKALRDKVRQHARKHGIEQSNVGVLRSESIDLWLLAHPADAQLLGVTA